MKEVKQRLVGCKGRSFKYLICVFCLIMFNLWGTVSAVENTPDTKQYILDIPSSKIDIALFALAREAGRSLIISSDSTADKRSQAIKGLYTLTEALSAMLKGTNLAGGLTENGVIVISFKEANEKGHANQQGREEKNMDNRKLKKSLLASIVTLISGASGAYAQANDIEHDTLESEEVDEIVITASRTGTLLKDLPLSVSTINEEDLQTQLRQTKNILSSLEFAVPGLNITAGEERKACNSTVRGRKVSYQINGVPVNVDLRPGDCSGPFQISPFALERVEVVRGGTALYGSGSPGGIINMVTRRASSEALEIDMTAQTSFNTSNSSGTFTTDIYAGLGRQVGEMDYYAGASFTRGGASRSPSGSYVLAGPHDAYQFVGSFGADLGEGDIRVFGTYYDESPSVETFPDGTVIPGTDVINIVLPPAHPFVSQASKTNATFSIAYHHPDLLGHDVSASLFWQKQNTQQRRNFLAPNDVNFFFSSDEQNRRLGLRTTLVREYDIGSGNFKTSYGFDYSSNGFYRIRLDPNTAERTVIGYVSPEVILRTYAFFGQAEAKFGDLSLSVGVREELYRGEVTDKDFDATLSDVATPGDIGKSSLTLFNAGLVYELTSNIQLYGGYSQGAELTQLGRAARAQSDPSIISPEPAPSEQFEVGLRGAYEALTFGLAAYSSKSEFGSRVTVDPSCAGQAFCPFIPLRVPERYKGFEANVSWAVTDNLDLSSVLTIQRGKAFLAAANRFVNFSSARAVPLRITTAAQWRPTEASSLGLQVTHYGASSYFNTDEIALGAIESEAVTLVSANASYKVGHGQFYIAASNLLNNEYVNPVGVVAGTNSRNYHFAAGRRVTLGYAARF